MIETNIAGPLGISLDEALRHMEEAYAGAIARALAAHHHQRWDCAGGVRWRRAR